MNDMTKFAMGFQWWTTRCISARGRVPRVLVVDDNSNGADALATYLGLGSKLKVAAVYGGAATIAAACVWKSDVVLLDISMPQVDGFTVAKALRGNARTASTVIVALTAHDEGVVRQRSSDAEFDAYCQKGLMLDSLSSLLVSFTQSGRTEMNNVS
ncbi:response regulator [Caballeronia jiangsuensis]|uniref:Response regulator n=1 Tax=Caballeronia jiangsuensis TaxID=1458357 RepID=A0ABW9D1F0_9BURK